jgi:beta-glucosidase
MFHSTPMIHNKRPAILPPLCLTLALIVSGMSGVCAQRVTDQQIEKRIEALLRQMTLEEKLGQLQQLDGESNGNFRPEHLELIRKGLLGATLNVRGAQRTNQLQRVAIKGRI